MPIEDFGLFPVLEGCAHSGARNRVASQTDLRHPEGMDSLVDPLFKRAVAAYFEALGRADQDGWLELFADDAISHDPVGAPPATGRSELSEIWRVMTSPFKKLTVVPEHIFHAGSGAAVKWSARGQSEIGGSVEFGGISVFEFSDDGKILTVMSYWDPAAMMIELAAAGERSG
jgi:ketosteroid isomerase-like protein